MSNAVQTLRAFRPSACRDGEDVFEERLAEIVRARNVVRYAKMVSEGAHLFEDDEPGSDGPAAGPPQQASAPQERPESGPAGR